MTTVISTKPAAPKVAKKSKVPAPAPASDPAVDTLAKLVLAPKPAPVEKKKRVSSKKTVVPVEAVEAPKVEAEVSDHKEVVAAADKNSKKKLIHEDVFKNLERISSNVTAQLALQKETKNKELAKVLQGMERDLKKVKSDIKKIEPKPKKKERDNQQPSGFLKPVKVSAEVSNFAGWDSAELKSRTDVTRVLCEYVKSNNLQDDKDRRVIVPDSKLAKLLNYDEKRDGALTFASMQKLIKPHFSA